LGAANCSADAVRTTGREARRAKSIAQQVSYWRECVCQPSGAQRASVQLPSPACVAST
jgi:hypothetical protein